jgi:hypothetical protein
MATAPSVEKQATALRLVRALGALFSLAIGIPPKCIVVTRGSHITQRNRSGLVVERRHPRPAAGPGHETAAKFQL